MQPGYEDGVKSHQLDKRGGAAGFSRNLALYLSASSLSKKHNLVRPGCENRNRNVLAVGSAATDPGEGKAAVCAGAGRARLACFPSLRLTGLHL